MSPQYIAKYMKIHENTPRAYVSQHNKEVDK